MTPTTWADILELFNLDGLASTALTGVTALVPVTVIMTGYLLFRRFAKSAPRG